MDFNLSGEWMFRPTFPERRRRYISPSLNMIFFSVLYDASVSFEHVMCLQRDLYTWN
jgi:hypothetical protein